MGRIKGIKKKTNKSFLFSGYASTKESIYPHGQEAKASTKDSASASSQTAEASTKDNASTHSQTATSSTATASSQTAATSTKNNASAQSQTRTSSRKRCKNHASDTSGTQSLASTESEEQKLDCSETSFDYAEAKNQFLQHIVAIESALVESQYLKQALYEYKTNRSSSQDFLCSDTSLKNSSGGDFISFGISETELENLSKTGNQITTDFIQPVIFLEYKSTQTDTLQDSTIISEPIDSENQPFDSDSVCKAMDEVTKPELLLHKGSNQENVTENVALRKEKGPNFDSIIKNFENLREDFLKSVEIKCDNLFSDFIKCLKNEK